MANARVLVAATAIVQVGCVLLVESSPTGDQFSTSCAVSDPASACGACMTQKCAAELSACCADTACRPALAGIDECADAGTCIVDTTNPAADALVKCVDQCVPCNAEPANPTNGAKIACFVGSSSNDCNCTVGAQNATRCDLTTVPNGICCADSDYPTSSFSGCSCRTILCESFSTGDCSCSPGSVGNAPVCDTSVGACCASSSGGYCSCSSGSSSCPSTELAVNNCALPNSVGCSTGQKRVNNCSPTAN